MKPVDPKRCERCGVELSDPTNRLCREHAKEVLEGLEAAGYLEPLHEQGVRGPRFLTLREHRTKTLLSYPEF